MQREIHKKFRLSDFKYVTFAINLSQSYGMINNMKPGQIQIKLTVEEERKSRRIL